MSRMTDKKKDANGKGPISAKNRLLQIDMFRLDFFWKFAKSKKTVKFANENLMMSRGDNPPPK